MKSTYTIPVLFFLLFCGSLTWLVQEVRYSLSQEPELQVQNARSQLQKVQAAQEAAYQELMKLAGKQYEKYLASGQDAQLAKDQLARAEQGLDIPVKFNLFVATFLTGFVTFLTFRAAKSKNKRPYQNAC